MFPRRSPAALEGGAPPPVSQHQRRRALRSRGGRRADSCSSSTGFCRRDSPLPLEARQTEGHGGASAHLVTAVGGVSPAGARRTRRSQWLHWSSRAALKRSPFNVVTVSAFRSIRDKTCICRRNSLSVASTGLLRNTVDCNTCERLVSVVVFSDPQ